VAQQTAPLRDEKVRRTVAKQQAHADRAAWGVLGSSGRRAVWFYVG